ncbi:MULTISPECIES: HAL/PAL/TAL family ammonia-lyase [Phyllobacterium]|jgi:histidine ammonia-lyase|uniref:Histidine ammonia-lyase n=1 Tax=Phyllobacterium sophorae TaxID=1520277 RepID=A0A2P7B9V6_9HYPH|nr:MULTISPECIES: aromatic amino acid lyase [Phyllobacterium]PSH63250.1 histidine ammonia-lyase [Phyllobacterium sophorae]UXN63960.1 aromatic amino acid lyase [Phyllobacterium sp. A18/5-2]
MNAIVFKGSGTTAHDIAAIARKDAAVAIGAHVHDRLVRARAMLDQAAAMGQQIYGLNTGLGANLKTPVTEGINTFQQQLVRGRGMGVGPSLPRDETRAVMAARLSMLAVGGSGISPSVFNDLLALLNKHVHPVLPSIGSIGAGDLVLLSAIARSLIGEGNAEYQGQVYPSGQALELSGLARSALGPKDGLSLLNASAVSVGCGALVVVDTASLLDFQRQAAALSFEALGGNPLVLAPAIQRARQAAGQAEEAEKLLALLEGSSLFGAQAAIQDPLSLRCVASIQGALAQAVKSATEAVEIELNAAADNPLVIVDEGRVLSTGNFHTPSLALAFETLGLAIAQAALASAARFIQLTGSGRNGLPRYLTPLGGASAGFVPLQKTVAALAGRIRHQANPVLLDFLPVSEGVEDHATQTPLAVAKCAEIIGLWSHVIACEMLAAAQGIDFKPGHRCGDGTSEVYGFVRATASRLKDDRALGDDVSALANLMLPRA